MAFIDRTKIAIPEHEVEELKPLALHNLFDGRKNPTSIPIISYRCGCVVIDLIVPRALFNNNLEEPMVEDWDKIVAYIQHHCKSKFLLINSSAIAKAKVWYLELGKNILIPIKYCLYNLIKKLSKCLAKYKTTIQHKQYVNETGYKGSKTAFLIKKRDLGFYDKTAKELSNGYAYNKNNQSLFKWLLEQGWQVLRYEVKMCDSATVKQTLKAFGIKPTFKDVWDSQTNNKFLLHFFESIKQTMPPTKSKDEILMKQIHTARQADVSMLDICVKVGMDVLERTFGATDVKNAFITPSDKAKGKKAEMAYMALRKKRVKTNQFFKDKKEYVIRHIEKAITGLTPIRVNKETGEIQGVLK